MGWNDYIRVICRSAISNMTIGIVVVVILIVAGVAGFLFYTSTTTTTTTKPITIVWSGEFTGSYATYEAEAWIGASIVINETNAAGGIHGRKLDVIKMDDQTSPSQALANARLADTQYNATVFTGTLNSDIALALRGYAETHNFPIVIIAGDDRMNPPGTRWTTRIVMGTAEWGAADAKFVLDLFPTAKIAIVSLDIAADRAIASGFKWYQSQTGLGSIVYDQIFPITQTDWTTAVAAIKASGATFIFSNVVAGSGATNLPKALIAAGFKPDQILIPTESQTTVGAIGAACVGCYVSSIGFTAGMVNSSFPEALSFVKQVNASIATMPNVEKVPVYEEYMGMLTMKVIVSAIHKVLDAGQPLTRTSFNDAVHSVAVTDMFGNVLTFTPDGAPNGIGFAYSQVIFSNPQTLTWSTRFIRYIKWPPGYIDGIYILNNIPP